MQYNISVESFSSYNLKFFFFKLNWLLKKKIFIKNFYKNQKSFFKTTIVFLPIKIKKYTLNKSPHVNKKAREQFETRVFKAIINIKLFVPLKKESIFIIFYLFKQFIKQSNFTSLIKSKINFLSI